MIEFIFGVATSLTANAIDRKIQKKLSFSESRKISAKVDEIVIAVVEPLVGYLEKEGIPPELSDNMAGQARDMVEWLINNPEYSFERGLDGERITRDLINDRENVLFRESYRSYPGAFETILRSLVDLVTKTPDVFVAWEKTSFQIMFKQIDEIKVTLAAIYDAMRTVSAVANESDTDFDKIVNQRATTAALKTNIHGLRKTQIPQAELDNLFVFPALRPDESNIGSTKEDNITAETWDMFTDELGEDKETIDDLDKFIDFVRKNKKTIIQGPAGSGKTTFSNWITSRALSCDPRLLPIVVPLRNAVKSGALPSLREALEIRISTVFKELLTGEKAALWASQGRLLVIFEGYDEVSEIERDRILDWIEAMCSAHAGLVAIVTARPLSTDHLDRLQELKWVKLRLLPFNKQRVIKYIDQFQQHGPDIQTGANPKEPDELAEEWLSDSTLRPLTGNPLLLSTLLVVHHMDGELPDDRSQLYDRYIDGMLGLWETKKELVAPTVALTKEQKKKILELIAINMISNEIDASPEEAVFEWIEKYLVQEGIGVSARSVLDHLRERSGLLIGPGQYTFAHKSIGEFLVAQSCNDGIQRDYNGVRFDKWLLGEKCSTDRWVNVVFLWAGVASKIEVQGFVTSLIKGKKYALSAGLMVERRKFLDKAWLAETFWTWISDTSNEGFADDESSSFYILDVPVKSLAGEDDRLQIPAITSISGLSQNEAYLIRTFITEGIVDPNDFLSKGIGLSASRWYLLRQYASISVPFFESCPPNITKEARCYLLMKEIASASTASLAYPEFLVEIARTHGGIEAYEALIVLGLYVSANDDIGGRPHGHGDVMATYYEKYFSAFDKFGLIDRVIGAPPEMLGEIFFKWLNDKCSGRLFMFSQNEKAQTLAKKCARPFAPEVLLPRKDDIEDYVQRLILHNNVRRQGRRRSPSQGPNAA